jgi:predicted nucleic acid-binding Zn ribbon protein
MSDDALTNCEECAGDLKKIITSTGGFQLKGKGWFKSGGY